MSLTNEKFYDILSLGFVFKEENYKMIRIDISNVKSLEDKKFFEERIGNRIVLNFLYTVAAYVALFIFYRYSTGFNGLRIDVIEPTRKFLVAVFVLLALASAGLYIWAALIKDNVYKKSTVRNHAHMLLLFAVGSLVINLTYYLKILFPVESTSGFFRTFLAHFRTVQTNYKLVAFLTGVIFVVLTVYNFVMYRKVSKITKKAIAKKQ